MKLYAFPASSYSRKIRVMLLEKNVPHEVEMVDLFGPNDLKKTNPVGKVPALIGVGDEAGQDHRHEHGFREDQPARIQPGAGQRAPDAGG